MANSNPSSSVQEPQVASQPAPTAGQKQPGPISCFGGSLVAGSVATGMYFLTLSIAQSFANKPITTTNVMAINISAAVRTLVVGMCALGMAVFGIAALGLAALGIQVLIQKLQRPAA